jgi:hypothetical protein
LFALFLSLSQACSDATDSDPSAPSAQFMVIAYVDQDQQVDGVGYDVAVDEGNTTAGEIVLMGTTPNVVELPYGDYLLVRAGGTVERIDYVNCSLGEYPIIFSLHEDADPGGDGIGEIPVDVRLGSPADCE